MKSIPVSYVEAAAKKELGSSTLVKSHSLKCITAPGDNFATTVVCIEAVVVTACQSGNSTTTAAAFSADSVEREQQLQLNVENQSETSSMIVKDAEDCLISAEPARAASREICIVEVEDSADGGSVDKSCRKVVVVANAADNSDLRNLSCTIDSKENVNSLHEGKKIPYSNLKRSTESESIMTKKDPERRNFISSYNNDDAMDSDDLVPQSRASRETVRTQINNKPIGNHEETWSCIAKMNSQKSTLFFKIFSKFAFEKEVEFYEVLLPHLNLELRECGEPALRVPQYFTSSLAAGDELLLMEDLRSRGYGNREKQQGLGTINATKVVRELARLHAASVLLLRAADDTRRRVEAERRRDSTWRPHDNEQSQCTGEAPITNKTNRLQSPAGGIRTGSEADNIRNLENKLEAIQLISRDSYLLKEGSIMNIFSGLVTNRIHTALDMLEEELETSTAATSWLRHVLDDVPQFLRRMLCDSEPKFRVLCHGDAWTNNFLFSSSSDCSYLLDFQLVRPASLATDLNYLLYSSCPMHPKTCCTKLLLDQYYEQFAAVLQARAVEMPFTRAELSSEVEAKRPWGLMGGVIVLPMIFPEHPPPASGASSEHPNHRHSGTTAGVDVTQTADAGSNQSTEDVKAVRSVDETATGTNMTRGLDTTGVTAETQKVSHSNVPIITGVAEIASNSDLNSSAFTGVTQRGDAHNVLVTEGAVDDNKDRGSSAVVPSCRDTLVEIDRNGEKTHSEKHTQKLNNRGPIFRRLFLELFSELIHD